MAPKKKKEAPPPKKGVDLAAVAGKPLKAKKIPPPPKCFTLEEITKFRDLYNLFDEEKTGKIPLKLIPTMLRELGFNPKGDEIKELFKQFLEDDFVDTVELHEWYFMIEAKMNWGDDYEHAVTKAFEFLGHDNPDVPTGLIDMDVLKEELQNWGETLTDLEWADFPKAALKEKNLNVETNEFQYVKFIENMNAKDTRFFEEPINYFKLDQSQLAKLAMEKAQEERDTLSRKEAERVAREIVKRQKMIDAGLLQPEEANMPIVAKFTEPPNPFELLREGR